jgi:hypothetical protein
VTGMPAFLDAYQAHGASEMEPDSYIIAGYLFASLGIETARRAIEAGDLTREGLMSALRSIDGWDINGLYPPISLTSVPYDATRQVRVTRPLMAERTWEVVSDYAAPLSDAGSG